MAHEIELEPAPGALAPRTLRKHSRLAGMALRLVRRMTLLSAS